MGEWSTPDQDDDSVARPGNADDGTLLDIGYMIPALVVADDEDIVEALVAAAALITGRMP